MQNQRRHKRKILNLRVNRRLQLGMIIRISCILFVCLLLCSAVYYYLANQEIGASFTAFHIKAHNFLDFLLPAIIGSFLVSLLVGVIATLFFPKNYAGGLYGIERDLKKVLDGDTKARIRIRRGDAALPLAGLINELLDSFQARVARISAGMTQAQQVLTAVELSAEEQLAQLGRLHTELLQELDELKN